MSQNKRPIKVFISCPGDVDDEANIIRDLCEDINTAYRNKGIYLKSLYWKKDITPLITGQGAQSSIDEQLKEYDYDIYIGIMWKRFGDKQESGLAPTEKEFEDAYERTKKTGRPIIQFYFKNCSDEPVDKDEKIQHELVKKFKKNRISILGLYDQFDELDECNEFNYGMDFLKKVNKSLLYIVDNIDRLNPLELVLPKIKYNKDKNYINRKVSSMDKSTSSRLSQYIFELHKDVIDVIEKEKRISLISDAGYGKSTELLRIAAHYSDNDSRIYPIFIPLNVYTNEAIEDLLDDKQAEWKQIPQNQLLIILDGLDEVEKKNWKDAIRQIENFCDKYVDVNILVSCRANFYRTQSDVFSGTLKDFSNYRLLGLDNYDINEYISAELGNKKEDFIDATITNKIHELLQVPFYLISLVNLYKDSGTLPKNRATIIEELLKIRITLDTEHYRNTVDIDEKVKDALFTLKRLAVSMEILGRNYIEDEEYKKIIPDESQRELLKYTTVWIKNEAESVTWQFEHNNFQEYLAAKVLSIQTIDVIKSFVSTKSNKQILPSWINTISILFSMIEEESELHSELIDWIKELDNELLIKFEAHKLEESFRIDIFKEIFENHKQKKIWIDNDRYPVDELAQFSQCNETVDYLLNEISVSSHFTTNVNALNVLSFMNIPVEIQEKAIDVLYDLVTSIRSDEDNSPLVISETLICLGEVNGSEGELIEKLVSKFRSSENDWIRYGLFYLIHHSNFLEKYIDVFLEGIAYAKYIPHSNSRLGNERIELVKGLEKAKSAESIKKILKHFIDNPYDINDMHLDKSITIIAKNAASVFNNDKSIIKEVVELISTLDKESLNRPLEAFKCFFEETDTFISLYKDLLIENKYNSIGRNESISLVAYLSNSEVIDNFVKDYLEQRLSDEDVKQFQKHLALKNDKMFEKFTELINKETNDKFIVKEPVDYNLINRQRAQKDLDILFDKDEFIKEINKISEKEDLKEFNSKTLIKIRIDNYDTPYFVDEVILFLSQMSIDETKTFQQTIDWINDNWNSFRIPRIYEKLDSNHYLTLNKNQIQSIEEWYMDNLTEVDFKKAIEVQEEGKTRINPLATLLWYFMRKYNLKYPNDVLLDMISFDWVDGGQMVGIKYLEELIDIHDMKNRIIDNLKAGIKEQHVLRNHIDFCIRQRITSVLPYLKNEVLNVENDDTTREYALKAIIEISDNLEILEELINDIEDDFKWYIASILLETKNKFIKDYLLRILEDSKSDDDKMKASEFLIIMNDLSGLEYYVNRIEINGISQLDLYKKSPLLNLKDINSVDLLVRLLKVSYEIDDKQTAYYRFQSNILESLKNIALISDDNNNYVKRIIREFISDNSKVIKNVNFLNTFLDKLDREYSIKDFEEYDIDEVLARIEGLNL